MNNSIHKRLEESREVSKSVVTYGVGVVHHGNVSRWSVSFVKEIGDGIAELGDAAVW